MKEIAPAPASPKWSSPTKLVVGLTFVAVVALLLIRFRNIIGPLILAFMLAYLLHPVALRLSKTVSLSWRAAVNLIYLVVLILVLALIALAGLAITQQLQSLIVFVQGYITNLPAMAAELSNKVYQVGPFELDFSQFDLQTLSNQVLSAVQPLLGRAGSLIGSVATSAATTAGWGLFVLLISYFLLAEAGKVSGDLVFVDIPGYSADFRRLNQELLKIWNSFLRGQMIIMIFIIISYSVLLMVLGVRFALGIAILAGLARFVPYIGPLVLWIVASLVTFFQGGNYFGLEPLQYAILVVLAAVVLDQVFDNLVTPRLLGQTLGVHPAAVLVAAIVAANLIGIIGLLLAAPAVASLKLAGGYMVRKMLDLDAWPATMPVTRILELPWQRLAQRIRRWWRTLRRR